MELKTTIASSVKSLVDPLKDSYKSVIGVFEKFNDDSETSIEELISNMESQVTGYAAWRNNLEKIRQAGGSEEFVAYLESLGVSNAATVKTLAASTVEQIQNASWAYSNILKAGNESIVDQMLFNSSQNQKKAKDWANNIMKLSSVFSSDFIKALEEKGVDYADVVEALVQTTPETAAKIQAAFNEGQSLPDILADSLILSDAGHQKYTETGEEAADDVVEGLENKKEDVKEGAKELTDGIAEGIEEGAAEDSAVSEATHKVVDNVETIVKTTLSKSKGKNIAKKFVTGLKNGFKATNGNDVVKPLMDTLNPALNTFISIYQRKFRNIGAFVAEGFARGIEDASGAVYAACEHLATVAINATSGTLNIASPSKVFKRLGEFTGEGFVLGLSSYDDAVYGVTQRLGDRAFDGLSESLADIYDTVDTTLSDDLVIRPIIDLSDVSAKASILDGLFNDDRSTRLGMTISSESAKLQNEKTETPVITRADVEKMIDYSAEKYGEAVISALDGVTFESVLTGEVNSQTLFDTVRQKNNVFKRTHGYSGI